MCGYPCRVKGGLSRVPPREKACDGQSSREGKFEKGVEAMDTRNFKGKEPGTTRRRGPERVVLELRGELAPEDEGNIQDGAHPKDG